MKKVLTAGAALLMTTTLGHAGGLDRSGQPVGIIFEEGNVLQLSFGVVSPSVSGVAVGTGLGTASSEDMSPTYTQLGFGYKNQINDQIAIAVIIDQPYGGNVDYETDTTYFAQGGTAEVTSAAVTGLIQYQINENASVYGGLRYQTIKSSVGIPARGYTLETDSTEGTGYVLGAAYEMPDIALRVAVTYSSEIEHTQDTTENGSPSGDTTFNSPQSINVDFQSGVAEDTLVFGSVRWVEWSSFDFAPNGFAAATSGGSILSYDEDTLTYTIGVGRRFNEDFSGFASLGYEAAAGGFSGNLGPTDGFTSIGLGGTYQVVDNVKVTGGLRYVFVGDADIEHPSPFLPGQTGAEFRDNSAIGGGLQLTYSF